MSQPVTVAVIPSAGVGSRMQPATRAIPKPLIPVVDRPVIQYVVEEAVSAGIEEFVLVVDDRPGDPVLTHFTGGDPIPGLEGIRFRGVVQSEPRGLGDAVLRARSAVDERPFACLLSDMFPRPGRGFTPRLVGMFDGRPTIALRRVAAEFFDRYGIVTIGENLTGDMVEVESAIEKPGSAAPSDLAILGRYVFGPEIFADLAALTPGKGGEIQLTDAIDRAARRDGALGLIVGDDLLDVGRPAGLLEATAAVGLSRPDLAADFREAVRHLLADS